MCQVLFLQHRMIEATTPPATPRSQRYRTEFVNLSAAGPREIEIVPRMEIFDRVLVAHIMDTIAAAAILNETVEIVERIWTITTPIVTTPLNTASVTITGAVRIEKTTGGTIVLETPRTVIVAMFATIAAGIKTAPEVESVVSRQCAKKKRPSSSSLSRRHFRCASF